VTARSASRSKNAAATATGMPIVTKTANWSIIHAPIMPLKYSARLSGWSRIQRVASKSRSPALWWEASRKQQLLATLCEDLVEIV
jgi:hypothetical protein